MGPPKGERMEVSTIKAASLPIVLPKGASSIHKHNQGRLPVEGTIPAQEDWQIQGDLGQT